MILLEAGDDAQIGLALGAMVLGLSPEDPAVRVGGVPAEIAAQRRSIPGLQNK